MNGKKKKKEPRRGVTHIGEAKYPNEAFKDHNELKILNRIQKNAPQHVLNKINPRLLALAQEEANADLEKAQGKFTEPKYSCVAFTTYRDIGVVPLIGCRS